MHKIGIIGGGGIAGMHAKSIHDLDNAQLVAVADKNPDAAAKFADENECQPFSDVEEMLEDVKPDVVTVCTPSGAHLEPVSTCLHHDIPVLCEKPLEIQLDRVDQMIRIAEQREVKLGCIFMQRYSPLMQQIYNAAAAGRFGDLAAVNGYVPWWRSDEYYAPGRWQGTLALDGGGAMMNQSIHVVDMVQWLASATMNDIDSDENAVDEVFAYTAKRAHDPNLIEVEDTATVSLKFKNGALGQLLGTTSLYPGALRRVQIGGRDGMAETLEDELTIWQFREPKDEDENIREQFGQASSTSGGASDPMAIDYANHRRNIAAFLESLESNERFMLDGREARKAVAVLSALYASAESGQPEKVK